MTDPMLLEEIGRAIGAALADANALAPPSEELSSAATSASPTGTSTAASAGSSGSAPATTQPPSTPGAPAQTAGLSAGYLPFASLADVRAWQASYESGGHQPWHRNPDLTARAARTMILAGGRQAPIQDSADRVAATFTCTLTGREPSAFAASTVQPGTQCLLLRRPARAPARPLALPCPAGTRPGRR